MYFPSSFQGHTIVGEGTAAQITAILVGDHVQKLPEARKGYPDAGKWIFKFCVLLLPTLYSLKDLVENCMN